MWIMGLRDEFTDAVDSIRDFQFHATKVRAIIESFIFSWTSFVSFSLRVCFVTTGKMRSRMFFYEQSGSS